MRGSGWLVKSFSACPAKLCRLQVAAKYMPVSQLMIGIDLAPIKPIPGVITMINDITTEKCRSDLKRELKSWKADVFLNDGAPNVGSAWVHDAFSQAELVLSALKLSTEFLAEGGTFVTKIFRSKDYNSLLWVFKQLFKTVEATKPASSRTVSAEIFVVCRGFLAPSHIDPKFLDPKYVFEEVAQKGATTASGINILKPEKKQRHREGYDDDQMVLHKTVPVMDFVRSADPVAILSTANVLSFADTDVLADAEIRAHCEDLKVIGRKEFKALLKWRSALRAAHVQAGKDAAAADEPDQPEAEVDPLKELDDLASMAHKQAKREKRKELEKKAKQRLRLQLQMETTGDLADDMQEEGLFNIQQLRRKAKAAAVMGAPADDTASEHEDGSDAGSVSDASATDSASTDDDSADEAARWDDEMEEQFQRYKQERSKKDALRFVKEQHDGEAEAASELGSGDSEDELVTCSSGSDSDGDAAHEDSGLNVDLQSEAERKAQLAAKAALFYSNPIFDAMNRPAAAAARSKRAAPRAEEPEELHELDQLKLTKKQRKDALKQKKAAAAEKNGEEKEKGIVFVKADAALDEHFDDDTKRMMSNPSAISLAMKLVADRRRQKEDLVDSSFNRYAFSDKGLPSWFAEDENRNNKPQIPISKDAAAAIKEKMRKLEAQPCKKVREAKGRNKMRAFKRLDALKKKAAVIADSEEIGGRQKSEQIEKIMRSAKKSTKKEKKVVVAKGKLKGLKGRPKGIKGHYKMVDGRAKKDMRAQKRTKAKQTKGRGRK